jgi:hypothetical protein
MSKLLKFVKSIIRGLQGPGLMDSRTFKLSFMKLMAKFRLTD